MNLIPNAFSANAKKFSEKVHRAVRSHVHRDKISIRRELAEEFKSKSSIAHIDEKDGYCKLPKGTISEADACMKFCQDAWRKYSGKPVVLRKQHIKKQGYRTTILAPRTYDEAPPIFDLMLCDSVIATAIKYLGEIPIISNVELWVSEPNDTRIGSQRYHFDGRQWYFRRTKFIFNINDINPENGPFTFIPAHISRRIADTNGRVKGRFSDDEILSGISESDQVPVVGPSGTGAAVDSGRCLHLGGRTSEGMRLLLMFEFLPIIEMVLGGNIRRTPKFHERFGNDPVRNLMVPLKAD